MPLVDLASAIRGFFQQHLISERGLSGNTVLSYRDAMKFFLAFACRFHRKSCTNLTLNDLNDDAVRRFLRHLAEDRHNSVKTRNDRLCAIHSFFQYLSIIDPSAMKQCQAILAVRHKSCPHRIPKFLEREEVQQVFRRLDLKIPLRLRDDALLRVLYNSGMRAQELVDLDVNHLRFTRPFSVLIHGKGRKERPCPLWRETIDAVKCYLETRKVRFTDSVPLFLNTYGNRLTRFGIRYIVSHRVADAAKFCPALLTRKVGPHTWRHSTALHLLQSNVDLTMISDWLGHASIETTQQYVDIDLKMKQQTLKSVEHLLPKTKGAGAKWKAKKDVLAWLSTL
ncbi:MAG: site-specific integrase [Verrucomicrobia bacterium]|nr:site-specific integrase [Verrucomicrobiota bacterium]